MGDMMDVQLPECAGAQALSHGKLLLLLYSSFSSACNAWQISL